MAYSTELCSSAEREGGDQDWGLESSTADSRADDSSAGQSYSAGGMIWNLR